MVMKTLTRTQVVFIDDQSFSEENNLMKNIQHRSKQAGRQASKQAGEKKEK